MSFLSLSDARNMRRQRNSNTREGSDFDSFVNKTIIRDYGSYIINLHILEPKVSSPFEKSKQVQITSLHDSRIKHKRMKIEVDATFDQKPTEVVTETTHLIKTKHKFRFK